MKLGNLIKLLYPSGRPPIEHTKDWEPNREVQGVWNPAEAQEEELTFFSEWDSPTGAGVVVANWNSSYYPTAEYSNHPSILYHDNPRYAAAVLATAFERPTEPKPYHQGTVFHPVHASEPFYLGSGSVVGTPGFGPVKNPDGSYFNIPHLGSVIIGSDVRIHSNTTIDRGVFSHTIIGDNVMIDNHVHVAHNCQIGDRVRIAAGAIVAGSVVVEDEAWIGIGATIMQGVTIGKGAVIGAGAVVISDVKEDQTIVGHHRIIETKSTQRGVM